jgi:hypothetical protein
MAASHVQGTRLPACVSTTCLQLHSAANQAQDPLAGYCKPPTTNTRPVIPHPAPTDAPTFGPTTGTPQTDAPSACGRGCRWLQCTSTTRCPACLLHSRRGLNSRTCATKHTAAHRKLYNSAAARGMVSCRTRRAELDRQQRHEGMLGLGEPCHLSSLMCVTDKHTQSNNSGSLLPSCKRTPARLQGCRSGPSAAEPHLTSAQAGRQTCIAHALAHCTLCHISCRTHGTAKLLQLHTHAQTILLHAAKPGTPTTLRRRH